MKPHLKWNKCWAGRPFGHTRRAENSLCPCLWGDLGPHVTMWSGLRTKWYLDPSIHLATIDMGRKLGDCCAPFFGGMGAGFPSSRIWPWPWPRPTSMLSGILIHAAVWPIDMGQKFGGYAPFLEGKLGPHLTISLGCLPSYQLASWSIKPFGHNRYWKLGGEVLPI